MIKTYRYKDFEEFFQQATGNAPYPYQTRLANSDTPPIISIPTGAGKTEASVLGLWLWKKINGQESTTRLIYCLPMRVLVEQTVDRVNEWVRRLGLEERIKVYTFMGDSADRGFDKHPNQECIIIGTQDMLLSGALNRAYGSVYSWPVLFGLFNNDCMWIMDEIQMMENALPTSIQLDAFRKKFKTFGACKTIWMSATINPEWFYTVDSAHANPNITSLKEHDNTGQLERRNNAPKTLHKTGIKIKKEYDQETVRHLHVLHRKGTVTIIMVNTVKRAQQLHDAFSKINVDCKLIHSRFRLADRKKLNDMIREISVDEKRDEIIIATQVLEAGVDISAHTMITEVAPWQNIVQRLGRCNRRGTIEHADVYWVDVDDSASPPYDIQDMEHARGLLAELDKKSVAPAMLPNARNKKIFDAVLRKRDLFDLFDNSANLSGGHTDASRFVRTGKQKLDVEVFWREKIDAASRPQKGETCSVSISDLRKFLGKGKNCYAWNYADGRWQKVKQKDVMPGQTIMLECKDGGYSPNLGWNENYKDTVKDIGDISEEKEDSMNSDPQSQADEPITLEDHTSHVIQETNAMLEKSKFLDDDVKSALRTVARYHDAGKIHRVFQRTMKKGIQERDDSKFWAKSPGSHRHEIPGFRHEAISSLIYLAQMSHLQTDSSIRDLTAYLIMSHHGKVRLSIRSMSRNRKNPKSTHLLGIRTDGDTIPSFESKVMTVTAGSIDVSIAKIGRNEKENTSWTERALSLLDRYGPFRLSYLEAMVRAADTLASQKEVEGKYA